MDFYGTIGPACADAVLFAADGGSRHDRHPHESFSRAAGSARGLAGAAAQGRVKKLLIDLQGPELRIGRLPQPLSLTAGQTVRLGAQGHPLPCRAGAQRAARAGAAAG